MSTRFVKEFAPFTKRVFFAAVFLFFWLTSHGQYSASELIIAGNRKPCTGVEETYWASGPHGCGNVDIQFPGAVAAVDYSVIGTGSNWKTVKWLRAGTFTIKGFFRSCPRGNIDFVSPGQLVSYVTPTSLLGLPQQTVSLSEDSPIALSIIGNTQALNWYEDGELLVQGRQLVLTRPRVAGIYHFEAQVINPGNCPVTYSSAAVRVNVQRRSELALNRVETKTYNGLNLANHTKAYFGPGGDLLQTQSKVLSRNQIMASAVVKDNQNRPVLTTLPAPTGAQEFAYKDGFFTNDSYNKFDYRDLAVPGNIGSTQIGTLGWYYSTNNSFEKHVPVTKYPYSQVDYYQNSAGEQRYAAAAGEAHRLGNEFGSETLTGSFSVVNELDDYISRRNMVIGGRSLTAKDLQGSVKVIRDANRQYTVTVADRAGRILMTARQAKVDDYDLLIENDLVIPSVTAGFQRDNRLYSVGKTSAILTSSAAGSRISLTSITKQSSIGGSSGSTVELNDGFYELSSSNALSQMSVKYKLYLREISYFFYDDAGGKVASISPNGFRQWRSGVAYGDIDKKLVMHDFSGKIVSSQENDAGVSHIYRRKDGMVRFSQNAKQAAEGVFSYIHYDRISRPMESGEYIKDAHSFGSALNDQLEFAEQIFFPDDDTRDWTKTRYDLPDKTPITGLYAVTQLSESVYRQEFLRGAVSATWNANIKTWYSYDEFGRVTWMAQKPTALNRVFVTTYQYDFAGSVLRAGSLMYDLGQANPLTQFYHHYEYDADGRLEKVYTSLTPNSTASERKLRAKYEYYLHGPIKRVELGEDLQGLDFVYNIHGWLTQINHPDNDQDPGNDGAAGGHSHFQKDVFGMVLNYYESEFQDLFKVSSLQQPRQPFDPLRDDGTVSPIFAALIQPAYMTSATVREQTNAYKAGDYSAAKPLFRELLNHFFAEQSMSFNGYNADSASSGELGAGGSGDRHMLASIDGQQLSTSPVATERRFLVDFGDPATPTLNTGWNNMTSGLTGAVSAPLIDVWGDASGIQVEIVKNASNGFGNGNYYNPDGYTGQVRDYPPTATRDSYFAYGPGGIYKVKGLNPGKYYTLTVFGSRASTTIPNRVGAYTINAQRKMLSAANNAGETVSFYNLKPTTAGEIVMDFNVASGSQFGYINVLDIVEKDMPGIQHPATLTAELVNRKGQLYWTDTSNETGYYIERRNAGDAVFNRIGSVAANITQYTDLAVSVGQVYEYRVSAYNDVEESLFSPTISLEVPGIPDKRYLIDFGNPSFPTPGTGWNNMPSGLPGSVLTNMVDSHGDSSAIDFEVIVDASAGFAGDGVYYNTVGYNGQAFDYPASACLDSYFSFGNGGVYKLKDLDPSKLYSITIFGSRVSSKNDRTSVFVINGVRQTLDAANNSSRTVTFYHMAPDNLGQITLEFGVDKDSFLGYMNVLDIAEVTIPIVETPASLVAQGNLSGVTLAWSDVASNETGYRIERKLPGETLFTMIGEVAPDATTFTDSKTLTGTTYLYRVYATYGDVHSAFSNTVTLTTPGNPPDRRYLIDFGSVNFLTTLPGWNNITSPLVGYTLSNIIDSNSNGSSIGVQIVKVASNGFGNGDVFNTDGYVGQVGDYPPSATRDSFFAYGPGGVYKLLGLNPNRFYTITIFGSRASSVANRTALFTINGKQYQLAANDNQSRIITFYNLVPDAIGQLELTFGVAPGSTHGYLGVMDIRETTTPTVVAPRGLAVVQDGRFASLQWTDNAANETGYMIERRSSEETVFKVIGKTVAGVSQFTDGVLATGRSFEYRVVSYLARTQPAIDTLLSAYSNTVSMTTPGVPSRRFLIDFGDPQTATTDGGWNNMTSGITGSVLNGMIDSNGGPSSIGFEIVKDAWNNYGSTTIYYNATGYMGPERVFGYPLTATRDSYFANAAGGLYKLKALNPNLYYTITIFGSRQGTDAGRVGSYIIHGEKKVLDGADNKTRRITFEQVKPNRAGEIMLDFEVETGSQFGYLNVMDFTELSVPELEPPVLEKSERLAGSAGVKITWSDNTVFEQSYEVYRATTVEGIFTLLATKAANTVTHTDATAAAGQTYYYRVRGIRTGAVTPYSNTLISDNTIDVPVLAPVENIVVDVASIKEVLLSALPGGNMPMDRKNIVILGSSTAEGHGASPIGNSWANQLGKALEGYSAGWNLINLAVYGFKTTDVMPSGNAEHNITKALTYNPLLVIINLPSNDLAPPNNITPEMFIANLTTIKQLAENAGVKVLITTTQPRFAQTLTERQVYQTAANMIKATFGAAAIDVYTQLAAADLSILADYNIDGVHVNNAGHGVLYKTIRPKVEAILNKTHLDFTLTNAPPFVTLEPQGDGYAKLIFTPGVSDAGTYSNVLISVIDRNGNYDEQSITIRAVQSDDTPVPGYRLKPLYNGLISAMSWRTESPLSDVPLTGMYLYEYDDQYQIKNANWGNPNFRANEFALTGNRFRLTGMAYDANGNIRALHRYDAGGVNTHWFGYKYAYDPDNGTGQASVYNNRLVRIAGHVNRYSYDEIGQVVGEDRVDGASQYIEYDASGKVIKVFSDANKTTLKIKNLYDDRGFRLAKVSYAETSPRTTWYIRDGSGVILSVYEQEGEPGIGNVNALDQTEVPVYGATNLGTYYPNQEGSMAYEIRDHLGNVRALIRDNINAYMATMEDSEDESLSNPRIEEMQYFENLFSTAQDDARMNHTPPVAGREDHPNKSAYLYSIGETSGVSVPGKSVGPSIALKVRAGDKFSLKTWARYEEKEDYTDDVPLAVFAQVLGTDLLAMPALDGVAAARTSAGLDAAIIDLLGCPDNGDVPRAFLNYIVFDENMVHVASHRVQVTEDAGFDPTEVAVLNLHEELMDSVEITTNGYIYVWVSNGSEGTKVWFDDLTIMSAGGLVTQATDYGVWGDVIREEKLDESKYRFGYQGENAEKDDETGWNHFESREYDPIVGRWLAPDPQSQHWSPYKSMGNDPVNRADADGEWDGYQKPISGWQRAWNWVSGHSYLNRAYDYLQNTPKTDKLNYVIYVPGAVVMIMDKLDLKGNLLETGTDLTFVGEEIYQNAFDLFLDPRADMGIPTEDTGDVQWAGPGNFLKGWIAKDLYSSSKLKNLILRERFVQALKNGLVGPKGEEGIKKLEGAGMRLAGTVYKYELKILGDGAQHHRLYGNMEKWVSQTGKKMETVIFRLYKNIPQK